MHRIFYKLPESALELSKVSKLLVAVEDGIIHKYRGKTLDSINAQDDAEGNSEVQMNEGNLKISKKDAAINKDIPDDPKLVYYNNTSSYTQITVNKKWDPLIKKRAIEFFKEEIDKKSVP